MTVAAYLKIKDTLTNTTHRIYKGKFQAFYKGKWIDEKAFTSLFPLPTVLNGCRENPDKTKLYLLH
jgi:hypothetical protein